MQAENKEFPSTSLAKHQSEGLIFPGTGYNKITKIPGRYITQPVLTNSKFFNPLMTESITEPRKFHDICMNDHFCTLKQCLNFSQLTWIIESPAAYHDKLPGYLYFCLVKKFTVSILLLTILTQTFYSATIFIWFQVNRDYITKSFCINKSRPEMKCKGNCYLARQLQQAEQEKSTQIPDQLKQWVVISPCILGEMEMDTRQPQREKQQNPYTPSGYCFEYTPAIFHPPLI
jgi:hypothetical protein